MIYVEYINQTDETSQLETSSVLELRMFNNTSQLWSKYF